MPTHTRKFATPLIVLLAVFPAALLPSRSQAAGEIYWFTLLSENVYAAMDFYTGLFGWEIDSSPTGGFIALRNGEPFAGLNAIEDRIPDASESMWLAAITVNDIDDSVAEARMLGAAIHEDVTELSGWGTFALIQDPQGAPLVLVSNARPLGGTQGYSGWRWAELWTHDTAAAAAFYARVIGYEIEEIALGESTYTAFRSSGKRNAGLVQLDRPEMAARWAPYVGVTDLRGILVRVWQERGKVLREPSEVDFEAAGENRVALIADPSGAMMFLYQLDENATPDPIVAADAARGTSIDPRAASSGQRDGPNIHMSVTVGYGFGPGWGSAYPAYPYRYYGPRY